MSAVLVLAVFLGFYYLNGPAPVRPGESVFEGAVEKGGSYRHAAGPGLTFVLEGYGPWTIKMFHASQPDKDLIYPVSPPYRMDDHLVIGAGYGKTAQESIQTFPRHFFFLYQEQDISEAWDAMKTILWPKSDQDLAEGTGRLAALPKGKGLIEVRSVEYYPMTPGSPNAGDIEEFDFIVHLSWGKNEVLTPAKHP